MPVFLERYLDGIPAPVLRFASSNQSSQEPTHYRYDAKLDHTVRQSTYRFEAGSRRERASFGYAYYSFGVNSADNIHQLLQIPDPTNHECIFHRFEVLQDVCAIARWRAMQAHMRNEESARLVTMISQIKQSYEDTLQIFEHGKYVFVFYAAVLVCQRRALGRYRPSTLDPSHPSLTITDYWSLRIVNSFLRDQLRRAVICYVWLRGLCAYVLSLLTWLESKRIIETDQWDRKFDAAVALRQYARDLGRRFNEVEGEVVPLRLIVEANDMAGGWERTRV